MYSRLHGKWIYRSEVQVFFNESWYSALMIYNNMKELGPPNGKGWANEPCDVMDIWNLFRRLESGKNKPDTASDDKILKRAINGGKSRDT